MSAHGEPASSCCQVSGGSSGMLDSVVGGRNAEWNGEWNGLWNGEWNGLWNGEWNGLWKGLSTALWNGLWNGEWNGAPNSALSWRSLLAKAPARLVSTAAGIFERSTSGWPRPRSATWRSS